MLANVGQFLIIVAQHLAKMNNHDFRAPIFGMGREVAINRLAVFRLTMSSTFAPPSVAAGCWSRRLCQNSSVIINVTKLTSGSSVAWSSVMRNTFNVFDGPFGPILVGLIVLCTAMVPLG